VISDPIPVGIAHCVAFEESCTTKDGAEFSFAPKMGIGHRLAKGLLEKTVHIYLVLAQCNSQWSLVDVLIGIYA
jgi:hypothetical protein